MSDEFDEITEGQGIGGCEAATLLAVQHQAQLSAIYWLTLTACKPDPASATDLTIHWMNLCHDDNGDD